MLLTIALLTVTGGFTVNGKLYKRFFNAFKAVLTMAAEYEGVADLSFDEGAKAAYRADGKHHTLMTTGNIRICGNLVADQYNKSNTIVWRPVGVNHSPIYVHSDLPNYILKCLDAMPYVLVEYKGRMFRCDSNGGGDYIRTEILPF